MLAFIVLVAVAGMCQAQFFVRDFSESAAAVGPLYRRAGLVVNPLGELPRTLLVMDRSGGERMVPLEIVPLAEEV